MCYLSKDDDYACLSKCERFFSPDPIHSRSCFCVRPLPHNMECSIQFRWRRNTEDGKLLARGAYLYLKLEPLLKSMAFCIDLGSSGSLKKAWYSTQFFQKDLHTSRLAMENSSVSLQEGWREIHTVSFYPSTKRQKILPEVTLTPILPCSLMRKCLRLKLSLRIVAQLKVLILVFP